MEKELPREKLIKYGINSLEDYEVLSLLICTGTKETNVFELSKQILNEILTFENL